VIGSLNDSFVSKDAFGRKINDPFPTPYPSSGFDLDAIGIIHGQSSNAINELSSLSFNLYPNPMNGNKELMIENPFDEISIECFDSNGKLIQQIKSNESKISLKLETSSNLILMRALFRRGRARSFHFMRMARYRNVNGLNRIMWLARV
jgi:hypothetical protein